MEPVSIALICAASFGALVAFSVFIRQLLLSRDTRLNDEGQKRALSQEAEVLAKIREEMKESRERFNAHYQILEGNKETIQYLDQKIEENLQKKAELIHRYAEIIQNESVRIVDGKQSDERMDKCHLLRNHIDAEIALYQEEIEHYQACRNETWSAHRVDLDKLLDQEKKRNENLDDLYQKHSAMLEKIILRHTEDTEKIATASISAGTSSFKAMLMAPVMFLMQYFGLAKGISLDRLRKEIEDRSDVSDVESDINDTDDNDNDNDVDADDDDVWSDDFDEYVRGKKALALMD